MYIVLDIWRDIRKNYYELRTTYCGTVENVSELKSKMTAGEEITCIEHPFGNDAYIVVPYTASGLEGAFYLIDPVKCNKDMVLCGDTIQPTIEFKPKSLPGNHNQSIFILGGQHES